MGIKLGVKVGGNTTLFKTNWIIKARANKNWFLYKLNDNLSFDSKTGETELDLGNIIFWHKMLPNNDIDMI